MHSPTATMITELRLILSDIKLKGKAGQQRMDASEVVGDDAH